MQRRQSRPVSTACTIRVVDVVDFSHVFYLPMPLAVCSAEIAHGFQRQKSPLVITLVMHRESIPVVGAPALSAHRVRGPGKALGIEKLDRPDRRPANAADRRTVLIGAAAVDFGPGDARATPPRMPRGASRGPLDLSSVCRP
jgi:hypothetical protein